MIKDRFQHSKALQETQGELELKVGAAVEAAVGAAQCGAKLICRLRLFGVDCRSRCCACRWTSWHTT